MELAEVEKSPKGSGAARADRRRAHLASIATREKRVTIQACLRRPAATATGGESFGRSLRRSNDSPEGCGSWTRRSSEPPLAEKPLRCTRRRRRGDQAASDTESAPICTGLPGTHKASCALPRCTAAGGRLRTRPKRGAHKRARCGASGDTGQRGELFFPICGTAAALLFARFPIAGR